MLRTFADDDAAAAVVDTERGSETDATWLASYAADFKRRFLSLLSFQFRSFPSVLCLSILEAANQGIKQDPSTTPAPLTKAELDAEFTPFDLKRLDSYANNMLDYHVILDMLPRIATLYFAGRTPEVKLSGVQQSILLSVGLQRKVLEDVERELNVAMSQLLAMFVKVVRKISSHFRGLVEGEVAKGLPQAERAEDDGDEENVGESAGVDGDAGPGAEKKKKKERRFRALEQDLAEELKEGGKEVNDAERERIRSMIDSLPLDK